MGRYGLDSASDEEVVIGHCVRRQALLRSDLLSGIGHADECAALPDSLAPEDILLWQTACLVDCDPPLEQLVVILRVRLSTTLSPRLVSETQIQSD